MISHRTFLIVSLWTNDFNNNFMTFAISFLVTFSMNFDATLCHNSQLTSHFGNKRKIDTSLIFLKCFNLLLHSFSWSYNLLKWYLVLHMIIYNNSLSSTGQFYENVSGASPVVSVSKCVSQCIKMDLRLLLSGNIFR